MSTTLQRQQARHKAAAAAGRIPGKTGNPSFTETPLPDWSGDYLSMFDKLLSTDSNQRTDGLLALASDIANIGTDKFTPDITPTPTPYCLTVNGLPGGRDSLPHTGLVRFLASRGEVLAHYPNAQPLVTRYAIQRVKLAQPRFLNRSLGTRSTYYRLVRNGITVSDKLRKSTAIRERDSRNTALETNGCYLEGPTVVSTTNN